MIKSNHVVKALPFAIGTDAKFDNHPTIILTFIKSQRVSAIC